MSATSQSTHPAEAAHPSDGTPPRPRIGIAGIAIESSTFTPYRSGADDFEVRRGTAAILDRYPFFSGAEDRGSSPGPAAPSGIGGGPSASGRALREAAEYAGVLHARALPGGQLARDVYEGWKQEIVEGLAAAHAEAPLDGFFFDIHGAMSVEGLEDAEGDLLTAIRGAIGPDVVVGTAMDLHGNVSHTLFAGCDLLTCYRHAPHIDAWETRERGLRDLVETAARVRDGGALPHKALVHVPILLPGEKTSTRIEPAADDLRRHPRDHPARGYHRHLLLDRVRLGRPAPLPGRDRRLRGRRGRRPGAALELAGTVWQARHDFEFVAPTGTFEECLDQAIASAARPFWISDSGDNPGAGGADDTTYCLARLADREEIRSGAVSALMVALVNPDTTDAAWQAGVGGRLEVQVGARIDTRDPGPGAAARWRWRRSTNPGRRAAPPHCACSTGSLPPA